MVTLNIVLDELASLEKEVFVENTSGYVFTGCLQMPKENERWEKEYLYVGTLSQYFETDPGLRDGAVSVCLREPGTESPEDATENVIIVDAPLSAEQLLTRIQSLFFFIDKWELQLYTAVSRKKSIQELLDLSVSIIPNHIQITDSTFMKVASTDSIPCDDPICVRLAKYGYHPEETVEAFRKNDLYSVWEKATDIYYDSSTNISKYPTLHRIFKKRGVYFAHSVMSCNNVEITPGLRDKYRILMDAVGAAIEQVWNEQPSGTHIYDAFFANLLEGKISNHNEILERAVYVGFPASGRFRIFCIAPRNNESVISNLMMSEFTDIFPRFKLLNYRQNIVAVSHSVSMKEDGLQENDRKLFSDFLNKYDADCGISLPIFNLCDISYGYQQVKLALRYRNTPNEEALYDLKPAEERIHRFEDLFPFIFTAEGNAARDIWYHSDYHNKLYNLKQQDRQHGKGFFKLLRVYIENERRITETAAIMNVHRNSLPYRIAKLQDILDMDLSDLAVRKRISFCFVLIGLYGFDSPKENG
ncbi:MAG: helix-turn-helix domain-containing protein [Lachnospiraceae bacterium]|nr:helix-turn-helix domain-containing protein [Lachnospiraceae bacterium]